MRTVIVISLVTLLMVAPLAVAHGAPSPRSIDARIVTDNTNGGDFGGTFSFPAPVIATDALDLLALDVREAYGPGWMPGVYFRLISQGGAAGVDHEVRWSFTVDGDERSITLETTDIETWGGTGFDAVSPSIPVGDGHPRAVDVFVSYASLGAGPGAVLDNHMLISYADGDEGDHMPGTYMTTLGKAPAIPSDNSASKAYTLTGPAALLSVTMPDGPIDLAGNGSLELEIQIRNDVEDFEQVVELLVTAPHGVQAVLDQDLVIVDAGGDAAVQLTLTRSASVAAGGLTVLARSDLGALGFATASVLAVKPVTDHGQGGGHGHGGAGQGHGHGDHSHDDHDHDHDHDPGGRTTPAAGIVVTFGILAAALLARRRI